MFACVCMCLREYMYVCMYAQRLWDMSMSTCTMSTCSMSTCTYVNRYTSIACVYVFFYAQIVQDTGMSACTPKDVLPRIMQTRSDVCMRLR